MSYFITKIIACTGNLQADKHIDCLCLLYLFLKTAIYRTVILILCFQYFFSVTQKKIRSSDCLATHTCKVYSVYSLLKTVGSTQQAGNQHLQKKINYGSLLLILVQFFFKVNIRISHTRQHGTTHHQLMYCMLIHTSSCILPISY